MIADLAAVASAGECKLGVHGSFFFLTIQLTDAGPSGTPEPPNRVSGPPIRSSVWFDSGFKVSESMENIFGSSGSDEIA